jgi:hypothetical protein
MTKKEVFQILKLIKLYYDSFEVNQERVDEWYLMLKNQPFSTLQKHIREHAAHSAYPPKICELIRKPVLGSRDIPNVEETRVFLHRQEPRASEETVQKSLEQMREILGMKRSEH